MAVLPTNYTDASTPTGAFSELPATTSRGLNAITAQINANTAALSAIYFNVKDYGAVGDDSHNDTANIQNAINAANTANGGVVFFPNGVYKITSALTIPSGLNVTLLGNGPGYDYGTPVGPAIIHQTSTSANGINLNDVNSFAIRGLTLQGPGSGTGIGVNATWTGNQNILGFNLKDVSVTRFGSHGISGQTVCASVWESVWVWHCGGDGIHLYGGGTSTTLSGCECLSNGGYGYSVDGQVYSSFNGCGADANNIGWTFKNGSAGCAVNGCGTEANTLDGLVIDDVFSIAVNGFSVYQNHRYGIHVTGSLTYPNVLLNTIWEDAGTGAVYAIYFDGFHADGTVFNVISVSPTRYDGNVNVIDRGLFAANHGHFIDLTANSGISVADVSTAQTLSGKRVTPRTSSIASSATPTINTDNCDVALLTALATNITSMITNLSGTPTDGQKLLIRFKDTGSAHTISWGASFVSSGLATLLATTVAGKVHHVGLLWDAAAGKWVCIAVDGTGY